MAPAIIVLALLAGSGLRLWFARSHLLAGLSSARTAADILRNPLVLRSPRRLGAVRGELERAQAQFDAARNDMWPWGPVLSHLSWLPVAGGQLAAAPAAADAAFYSTRAAAAVAVGLGPVLDVVQGNAGHGRLPAIAGALAREDSRFREASRDADLAAAAAALLPARVGSPSLDRSIARLRTELPRLRTATAWLALAPPLLGEGRPNRILFAWENPAELRAAGGFLGASDLLTLRAGHLGQYFNGHLLPHEIASVLPPLPEGTYTPEAYWLWCDSNWSPDFPLSARLERWFYGEDTGFWASGVANFLDTATPEILRGTGPVYLPGYHLWASASNVTVLAQRFVNGRYKGPIHHGIYDTVRKQFFGAVMQAIVRRAETMPLDRWPSLAKALGTVIARRQLLIYDRDPSVEAAIREVGADGAIHAGAGDYLYVVDDNRSYNKLNPYVREAASYRVTVRADGSLRSVLTIRYHVDPSPADLEGHGPMWGAWGSKHDYQDFVRVLVPPRAKLLAMTGFDAWAPRRAYGLTQFAGRILVRQGGTHTVSIVYDVPANALDFGGSGYLLRAQPQPGGNLQAIDVRVAIAAARSNVLTVRRLNLTSAAFLRIPGDGIVPAHSHATRKAGSFDPYLPYRYLDDPRHIL